jgi:hypothetical protein
MLDDHSRLCRSMDEPNRRVDLVPVLASLAVPAIGEDIEVLVGYLDLARESQGENGDGGRRGVTTPPAVALRYPLDSVYASEPFIGTPVPVHDHHEGTVPP